MLVATSQPHIPQTPHCSSFLHVCHNFIFLLGNLQNLKLMSSESPEMINRNCTNLLMKVMMSNDEPISHFVRYCCLRNLGVIRQ
jgi:hypothetical protein